MSQPKSAKELIQAAIEEADRLIDVECRSMSDALEELKLLQQSLLNHLKQRDELQSGLAKLEIGTLAHTPCQAGDDAIHGVVKLLKERCLAGPFLSPIAEQHEPQKDFDRGVKALALELHRVLCQSAQGRQALLDFGLQPLFENLKGEGSGGCHD